MAHRSRVKVSQYAAALTVAPGGMKSTRRMHFMSQKTETMNFFTEIEVLNFLVLGECVWLHCLLLGFRNVVKTPYFISSQNGVQKLIILCAAREKLQRRTHPFRFVIVR